MKSPIGWFDIPTLDLERAVKFYSTVIGEPVNILEFMGMKMGFFPMEKDGDTGGALMPPGSENTPSKTGTRVYLAFDGNLDEAISRVEPAGGMIRVPKMAIGEAGFIAMMEDTEGNIVGLHSYK
jgi:predicted enzyme related to lactoylglutathione lyase